MLVWLFILVKEVLGVIERMESVDLSPGGQMPYLPRVRSSKLKANVLWMYSEEEVSERRRTRGSEELLYFFQSAAPVR